YKVLIDPNGIDRVGAYLCDAERLSKSLGKKMLVVSNPQIWKHYGKRICASLEQSGFKVESLLLPAGERYKTTRSIQKIYDQALAQRLERSSTMVALGGGVIGDMTGFAAASWLRGINVVQVPTSLLAMVDASIGGKTGVNHPQGKNLIGAFHQPALVLIDPLTLKTLKRREFRTGMAEVIKYGVIWDADLFGALEGAKSLDRYQSVSEDLLLRILDASCQTKADVVTQDELESGLRAILNYGHTVGHAIESLTNYRMFTHGEAVGLGMMAAGHIAVQMGLWTQEECDRQDRLIHKCGLPTKLPSDFDEAPVLDLLLHDKKVRDGKVRFVLPTQIGKVEIFNNVQDEVILKSVQKLKS
ncbi:MAG: 3-dehydroquinate synthase, partial [Cyanobacteria bacterium P01_F01_bin.42]